MTVPLFKFLFEEPAALLVRFWETIPDYLPFYLLVVLVIYTLWGSRHHTTVIAPFNLPSGDRIPFSSRTVANSLRDAFTRIRFEVNTSLAEFSKRGLAPVIEKKLQEKSDIEGTSRPRDHLVTRMPDSPSSTISEDIDQKQIGSINFTIPKFSQFSLPTNFEVPTQFQAQVQGLSHAALLSLGRRVLGNERLITGDILSGPNNDSFFLIARSRDGGPWKLGPFNNHADDLTVACERLALEIHKTFEPSYYAAYLISQGEFDAAYRILDGVLADG